MCIERTVSLFFFISVPLILARSSGLKICVSHTFTWASICSTFFRSAFLNRCTSCAFSVSSPLDGLDKRLAGGSCC